MKSKLKNRLIKLFYILIDVACVWLAIFISCAMRKHLINFPLSLPGLLLDPQNPFRFISLFWAVMTIIFMNSNSLYQTRREVWEGLEVWLVIKSVILAALFTVAGIYAVKLQDFPRTIFLNTVFLMIVFLSLWRVLKRWFVEYLVSHGYNNFNALVIGAGKVGTALAQEIHKHPGLGIKITGFLDDTKTHVPGAKDIKVLGKISDFAEILRREFIQEIYITIHHDNNIFLEILEYAKERGIAVRVIPHGFELASGEFYRLNIGFIPILEYCAGENLRRQVGKRFFDFILSLSLFLVFCPVLLVIAVLIKLNSPGPVFYLSKRYGRWGRKFNMYKFRSMVINAENIMDELRDKNEKDGPIFKMKNDPRVTGIGQFLRKFSLDELPQIINVLKGEMSLVGPRPLPINQVEKEDIRQLKRLEVRPGITGLWQVRGRSDISFARLVKWDIWYINNWSFWLDLNILAQTLPVVLKGRGAY